MNNTTLQAQTQGDQMVAAAQSWLGVPYLYGGDSRAGVDCSGLYKQVAAAVGLNIPRTTETQVLVGKTVSADTALPGDAVFFGPGGITGSGVNGHVGIYVGGGMMIDAPHTGTVVRYDRVQNFGSESISAWKRIWNDTGVAGVTNDTSTNGSNLQNPQAVLTASSNPCLLPINWPSAGPLGGGTTCLFYESWGRALLGGLLVGSGAFLILMGTLYLAKSQANFGVKDFRRVARIVGRPESLVM